MSNFYFGQDPTDLARTLDFFQQQSAIHPEAYWLALVDGAFDYEQRSNLAHFGGISCYNSPDLEGLADVAPRLIALGTSSTYHEVLSRLMRHCSERPMLSVIASHVSMIELLDQWQPHHWVRTSDGQKLLLRFADTRVLPVLSKVLVPEQWAALTSSMQSWFYIDRKGRPDICVLAASGMTTVSEIELDASQLDALVEHSEADSLLDYLVQHMFDVIPADAARASVYGRISAVCALARAHDVDSWADKVALATADCLTDSAFLADPRLPNVLADSDWPQDGLGERLIKESIV
jgi:hypothetical protein